MTPAAAIVDCTEDWLEKRPGDNTRIEWLLVLARAHGMRADVLGYQEGCSEKTGSCRQCWAREEVYRRGLQQGEAMRRRFGGLTRKVGGRIQWTGEIRVLSERLAGAVRRKHPTFWFPASRSDVFHEKAEARTVAQLLAVAAARPDHRMILLTKRWERAADLLVSEELQDLVAEALAELAPGRPMPSGWPLANVIVGCSVGNQAEADAAGESMSRIATMQATSRIATMQATSRVARSGWATCASAEPMRGPIDFSGWEFLRFLIVGGMTGGIASEPLHPLWVEGALGWARVNGVPAFFKQWGDWAMQPETGTPVWLAADGRCFDDVSAAADSRRDGPAALCRLFRVGKVKAGRRLPDGRVVLQVPILGQVRHG